MRKYQGPEHTGFLPSIGNRAMPFLVILVHPDAGCVGKNILLTFSITVFTVLIVITERNDFNDFTVIAIFADI